MKHYNLLGIACAGLITLTSCADTDLYNTQVRPDLSREDWIKNVNLNPNVWTKGADSWFIMGKPTNLERSSINAPYSTALTTSMVRVPDFTTLKVEGRFKVQIMGRQQHNSAYIFGPNDAVRDIVTEIHGDTVYIHEAKNSKANYMDKVLVRVGVKNLRNLIEAGNVQVEGRELTSDNLCIKSSSSCNTYLAGNMNVTNIIQAGSGDLTIIGAYTPSVNVRMIGKGNVNIDGRVGLNVIENNGGDLNVIGADSSAVTIMTGGYSTTSIVGYANVKKITAKNSSRVYLYWVNSDGSYVNAYDNSRIGLAGAARNMNVDVASSARFEGQYLRAENIYVRTHGYSHANVNASRKMFAAALDNSSIYFYGSPNIVSRYTSRSSTIIPVWSEAPNVPSVALAPPAAQGMNSNVVNHTTPATTFKGEKGDEGFKS